MISLASGARLEASFESVLEKGARGMLYVLSGGIVFEKGGSGPVLEASWDDIASFEAVGHDRLLVVLRDGDRYRKAVFRVSGAAYVAEAIRNANSQVATGCKTVFDQDVHSRTEAAWFAGNWDDIMRFLKPERAGYLREYVRTARTGSPGVDPYLLVVKYENLTFKDFADLPGFLRWRYRTITDNEVGMIADVFRDFDDFSVSMLEMDVQVCKPREPSFRKKGYSLYQFVAIVAREKFESSRQREPQQVPAGNPK